jgi:hypothetical protein
MNPDSAMEVTGMKCAPRIGASVVARSGRSENFSLSSLPRDSVVSFPSVISNSDLIQEGLIYAI